MPAPAILTIHTLSTGHHELRADNAPWAVLAPEALPDLTPDTLATLPPAPNILIRAARPITPSPDAESDAESAFAAWSRASWDSFDTSLAALTASTTRPLILWTNAGAMLSDAVSTLSFARRQPAVGLMVDPVAWLTPAMLKDAPDHLARFAQALTLCESIDAVVLRPLPGDPDATRAQAALAPLLSKAARVLNLTPAQPF